MSNPWQLLARKMTNTANDPDATVTYQDDFPQAAMELISSLGERERLILSLRIGLGSGTPHTLESIGRMFGISKERVRQLEVRALRTLRNKRHGLIQKVRVVRK